MNCSCNTPANVGNETFTSVDLASVNRHHVIACKLLADRFPAASAAVAAFNERGAPVVASGLSNHLHITLGRDPLVSAAFAKDKEGHVVLTGTIGAIPFEIDIHIKLEGTEVVASLLVKKPVPLGPYTWKFELGGVIKTSSGEIVGASSVAAVDLVGLGTDASRGLDWWCVAKCGGTGILKTLVLCLPSLGGGPAAYIACVTGKLGQSSAEVALCIATSCV